MRLPYGGYFAAVFNERGAPGVVLMARNTAQGFANLGWSKERIKERLWENSRLPQTEWLENLLGQWSRQSMPVKDDIRYPMPITPSAKNILVVVAGGEQSGHSYWLQVHRGRSVRRAARCVCRSAGTS